jgi:hypothetical protein
VLDLEGGELPKTGGIGVGDGHVIDEAVVDAIAGPVLGGEKSLGTGVFLWDGEWD